MGEEGGAGGESGLRDWDNGSTGPVKLVPGPSCDESCNTSQIEAEAPVPPPRLLKAPNPNPPAATELTEFMTLPSGGMCSETLSVQSVPLSSELLSLSSSQLPPYPAR